MAAAAYTQALRDLQRSLPGVANTITTAGQAVRVFGHGPWLALTVDLRGVGRQRSCITLAVTQDGANLFIANGRPEFHARSPGAPTDPHELDRWWLERTAATEKASPGDLAAFAEAVALFRSSRSGEPHQLRSDRARQVLTVLERLDLPTLALFHAKTVFNAADYRTLAALPDEPGSVRRLLQEHPLLLPFVMDEILLPKDKDGAPDSPRGNAADPFDGRPAIEVVAETVGEALKKTQGSAPEPTRLIAAIRSLRGKIWDDHEDLSPEHIGLLARFPKPPAPRSLRGWRTFVEIAGEATALIGQGVAIDRLFPDFDGDWAALRRPMLEAGVSRWPDQVGSPSVADALWLVRSAPEIIGLILADSLTAQLRHAGAEENAGSLPAEVVRRLTPQLFDGRPLPDLVRAARALHDGLAEHGESEDSSIPRGRAETLIRLADNVLPEELRGLDCNGLLERLGFDVPEIERTLGEGNPVEFDEHGDLKAGQGRVPGA